MSPLTPLLNSSHGLNFAACLKITGGSGGLDVTHRQSLAFAGAWCCSRLAGLDG